MDAMNVILANACPSRIVTEGDKAAMGIGQVGEYLIETHCVTWTITAKLIDVTREPGASSYSYVYAISSMTASDTEAD